MLFTRATRWMSLFFALSTSSAAASRRNNESARYIGNIQYYPDDQYHDVVAITESDIPDHVYTRVHPHKSGHDVTLLVILAAFKLILVKAGGFGFLALLLFKVPLFLLFGVVGKFLIAFKAAKLVKILSLPMTLLGLLPLLAVPVLLLAPLLLPLLLALPIPVLTPTTTTPASTGRRRRRRRSDYRGLEEVLRSEQCLERIACQLGSKTKPSFYTKVISWALEVLQKYVLHPKMSSYTQAFKSATLTGVTEHCLQSYACNNPPDLL